MARRPSVLGYVAAALLAVAGIAGGVVLIVFGVRSYVDRVEGFERFALPGSADVALEEGGHSIYFERIGLDDADDIVLPSVSVTARDGTSLPLRRYGSTVSYDVSGHDGRGIFTFSVDEPGPHRIRADGSEGELAVGRGIGSRLAGSVVGGIGLILLGPLLGLVLFTVTLVRRSRAKRSARTEGAPAPPPGWGPPPPSWGPPPPPPPPGGATGWR